MSQVVGMSKELTRIEPFQPVKVVIPKASAKFFRVYTQGMAAPLIVLFSALTQGDHVHQHGAGDKNAGPAADF